MAGAWILLEIKLMSFIPLMFSREASLKYFIIQALQQNVCLCNHNLHTSENRDFPTTLMVPKSDRWCQMNRLLVDNNSTESCTHNANPVLKKNRTRSPNSIPDVSDHRSNRRDKPNFNMKDPNLSVNHTGWVLAATLGGDNLWIVYFAVLFLLTAAITTITKSCNISFLSQAVTVNEKAIAITYFLRPCRQ